MTRDIYAKLRARIAADIASVQPPVEPVRPAASPYGSGARVHVALIRSHHLGRPDLVHLAAVRAIQARQPRRSSGTPYRRAAGAMLCAPQRTTRPAAATAAVTCHRCLAVLPGSASSSWPTLSWRQSEEKPGAGPGPQARGGAAAVRATTRVRG